MYKNNNYYKLFIIFFSIIFNLNAQESNSDTQNITSGILTYKISGDFEDGTETLYFTQNKLCIRRKVLQFYSKAHEYMATPEETLYVVNDKEIFIIDLTSKKGKKFDNLFDETLNFSNMDATQKVIFSSINQMIKPLENKILSDKKENITFFGKQCEVLNGVLYSAYLWKNLILRFEILKPYKRLKEITSLKINVKVPENQFWIPAYIEISSYSINEIKKTTDFLNQFKENLLLPKVSDNLPLKNNDK